MKWFTFKWLAVLGALLVAPMLIKGPDGKPIMSISDWIPNDLLESAGDAGQRATALASELAGKGTDAVRANAEAQVYSWRDANGTLHFSDRPVDGAKAIDVTGNTLEIPADRFVQDGTRPVSKDNGRTGGRATLLRERDNVSGSLASASGAQPAVDNAGLEALIGGDFSKAGDVLKSLPALLEQAKKAREMPPEAR
ncbi:MAG: DUF4124 domain-containing protein [Gammaproteobacteria bacterium]|nr:DUF4124 domain-containing protein [Gammaproteobacteria bacterium]NND38314.1 DUF4124 domain-containing protein [Pseudomonadales bacterium]NNL11756.1 DUF4124 domain-containing protein [Pseudomonadales bacterium]NNM11458.1 DUF4124 domain-containing protein [Pseudomonadales bacterium]RZV53703.1 MAG: DUF4124 domain-containing protein [Pseudomonadales bacterium]